MAFATREEHNEYHRAYKAARRAEWFADKSCVMCGVTEELQADHIDPEGKSPHIKVSHNVWSWSEEKRDAELEKCQVLCDPCHKEKTAEWWASRRKHGTPAMYRRGCKCEECRADHCRRMKEYRARKKKC
ncbi:hypothetical protein ALICE_148 [Mycobacterium phage Alice]|uniref:HNH nuclease domain-containing protein n=1 Tax=Mycobacterium phage Alice TaxID=1034128 RepID=G1BKP2_9CAUD|nr:HNH endonuclease [Mycobacterium phage Alice]AEJ94398.1 hypothetical protein ALICE_148 [Mycobacterium phage Alice]